MQPDKCANVFSYSVRLILALDVVIGQASWWVNAFSGMAITYIQLLCDPDL